MNFKNSQAQEADLYEKGRLQNIMGTHVNYYFVCHTKLWYFAHNIQMEQESDLVALGKLTHEEHYTRDSKKIPVIGVVSEGNLLGEGHLLHSINSTASHPMVTFMKSKRATSLRKPTYGSSSTISGCSKKAALGNSTACWNSRNSASAWRSRFRRTMNGRF